MDQREKIEWIVDFKEKFLENQLKKKQKELKNRAKDFLNKVWDLILIKQFWVSKIEIEIFLNYKNVSMQPKAFKTPIVIKQKILKDKDYQDHWQGKRGKSNQNKGVFNDDFTNIFVRVFFNYLASSVIPRRKPPQHGNANSLSRADKTTKPTTMTPTSSSSINNHFDFPTRNNQYSI